MDYSQFVERRRYHDDGGCDEGYNSNAVENDDVNVFMKMILYSCSNPQLLAQQISSRLQKDLHPLSRYYEMKENLQALMWTLEDIFVIAAEKEEEEQLLLLSRHSSSSSSPQSTLPPAPLPTVSSSLASSSETTTRTTTNHDDSGREIKYLPPKSESLHVCNNHSQIDDNIAREEEEEEEVHYYPPLECLRRISESGYLTSKELGRLLLLTSPGITKQLSHNFCWTCLCELKFGSKFLSSLKLSPPSGSASSASNDATTISSSPFQNPEWLFRQFMKGLPTQPRYTTTSLNARSVWPPIPPPQLEVNKLQFVLMWYSNKQQYIDGSKPPNALLSIKGRRLNEFVQRGQVTIPVVNGRDWLAPSSGDGDGTDSHCPASNTDNVIHAPLLRNIDQTYVRIYAIRHNHNSSSATSTITTGDCDNKDDSNYQICCIHETDEFSWDASNTNHNPIDEVLLEQNTTNTTTTAQQTRNQHVGDLYLGPSQPILLKQSGKDLETRLAREDREPGGFEILVIGHVTKISKASTTTNETDTDVPAVSIATEEDEEATSTITTNADDDSVAIDLDAEDEELEGGETSTQRDSGDQEPTQQGQEQEQRVIQNITLQFWANYSERLYIYNSREQSQKHGVTLLHILDELDGWT